jgi:hypothetical protein
MSWTLLSSSNTVHIVHTQDATSGTSGYAPSCYSCLCSGLWGHPSHKFFGVCFCGHVCPDQHGEACFTNMLLIRSIVRGLSGNKTTVQHLWMRVWPYWYYKDVKVWPQCCNFSTIFRWWQHILWAQLQLWWFHLMKIQKPSANICLTWTFIRKNMVFLR